jgi:histone H3/H4
MKKREFSLYDIEQFLREAGAERVNERAVISLEKELEDTVRELVGNASMYASYAGRKRLIKNSDVDLAMKRKIERGAGNAASFRASALGKRPRVMPNQVRIRMQKLNTLVQAGMLEQ